MKLQFLLIFFGLILLGLDFRFNGFDIFPDVVGYSLIAIGCFRLAAFSSQFLSACAISSLMAIWQLVSYIPHNGSTFLNIVQTILYAALIWLLLGGIMKFAAARERRDLSERASNRRNIYVALIAAMALIGFVAQVLGPVAILLLSLLAASFVVLIMILHLIYRVQAELAV